MGQSVKALFFGGHELEIHKGDYILKNMHKNGELIGGLEMSRITPLKRSSGIVLGFLPPYSKDNRVLKQYLRRNVPGQIHVVKFPKFGQNDAKTRENTKL